MFTFIEYQVVFNKFYHPFLFLKPTQPVKPGRITFQIYVFFSRASYATLANLGFPILPFFVLMYIL